MTLARVLALCVRCVPVLLLSGGAYGQYVGSQTCQGCHPGQFAAQAQSEHAHALAPAKPGSPGEWAFGAARKAITFVSHTDEETYVERAASYYASTKSMGVTPGHKAGIDLEYPTFHPTTSALRCFRCHSTGDLTLSSSFAIQPAEYGIRCEACHGPGGAHVAAGGGAATIRSPKRLNAVELNGFCGTCHRKPPEAGVEGDWTDPWNVRHQPASLSQAACFRGSAGRLSCLTCHDPHAPLVTSAKAYDQRCQGCHEQVRHRTATAGTACVTCHMPQVQEPAPQIQFTNHWIGIYAKGNSLVPVSRPGQSLPPLTLPATSAGKLTPPNSPGSLLPLFAEAVSLREKRLGAWDTKVARSLKAEGQFLKVLGNPQAAAAPLGRAVEIDRRNHDPDLYAVEEALAQAFQQSGNRAQAFELFQEAAVGTDPEVAARSYASLGPLDPARAADYYAKAIAAQEKVSGPENPRVAMLLNRLAQALEQKQNPREAEALLRRALAIQHKALGPSPDTATTLINLGSLLQNLGRADEAERMEREAIGILEQKRPHSVELAAAYTNLADLLSPRKDFAPAAALLQSAIAIDEAIYGTGDPEVAVDLTNLGELLKGHGQNAAARTALNRALAIYEKRLGADSPQARDVRESLQQIR
ncbi:MAG TPA: tetratricopeptide repeat protein [Candidatus Limnocylindrales bacterium]|nr:tetratricopeptide repeat protein [Candidatus Limnocylindrales bacterium]